MPIQRFAAIACFVHAIWMQTLLNASVIQRRHHHRYPVYPPLWGIDYPLAISIMSAVWTFGGLITEPTLATDLSLKAMAWEDPAGRGKSEQRL